MQPGRYMLKKLSLTLRMLEDSRMLAFGAAAQAHRHEADRLCS
jgi:hypothetical protein